MSTIEIFILEGIFSFIAGMFTMKLILLIINLVKRRGNSLKEKENESCK